MPKQNWLRSLVYCLIFTALLAPLAALAAKPEITSPAAVTFPAGVFSTFTVTVDYSGIARITRKKGRLPAGVTFVDNHNNTATISGTPAVNAGGAYNLQIRAKSGPHDSQNFVLTVSQSVTFTSATLTTCAVSVACKFTVTTTGFPFPTIVRTGTLPSGMSFVYNGSGKGTLQGTPAIGSQGFYPLTFTANNGGADVVQNFSLTVNPNVAFTSADNTTCTVGIPCTFSLTAAGKPLPPIVRSGGVLPAGMNYVKGPNGSGTLFGTPAPGTGGVHPLQFTAHNGVEPDAVQDFTLTINQAPKITSANALTCAIDSLCGLTVVTTGFPAPVINITGATLPVDITYFDNGDGTGLLTGVAETGNDGVFALVFTASNGVGANAVQNFTLTVNPSLAITSDDNKACTVGVACSFTVTTTGVPTPAIAISGPALPSLMTFADNGNGTATISGTPAAGTAGNYTNTLTASNGVESNAVQTFKLTVNQAPAITSVSAATCAVGFPCAFTVVTTGFPTAAIVQTGDALPLQMTFFDNGNGTGALSGAPIPGTIGVYNVVFTASNNVGVPAMQNFTLTVTSGPSEPLDVSAQAGNAQATVTFLPPTDIGSSAITGYTVTCTPTSGSPVTATGAGSPIIVPGLTNGVTYTCTVHATNSEADGSESASSNPVTPSAGGATAMLTVTVGGTGTGSVSSLPAGIACPGDCSESYSVGTGVVLTAVPTAGSVFTGWLGACIGIDTCTVTLNADAAVSATFGTPATLATLDIDLNTGANKYTALTDGVLVVRYLFGLTGPALVNGVLGPTPGRATGAAVQAYLDNIRPALDIDGNGQVDIATDGRLILRALFGLTGAALTNDAIGPNATRGTPELIQAYIDTLKP